MSRKVTAPVARSTAYDFNAQLAKCHLRNTPDDCLVQHAAFPESRDVMPHEILFATRKDVSSGDSRIRCMSSLNGVKLNSETTSSVQTALKQCGCPAGTAALFDNGCSVSCRNPLKEWLDTVTPAQLDTLNNALTQNFVYMGVAITPCKAGSDTALQRQGFSATRGGLMTVLNTGRNVIKAGQQVRMVLDVKDVVSTTRDTHSHLDGVPRQKILARLQSADDSMVDTFAQVLYHEGGASDAFTHNEPFALTAEMKYVAQATQTFALG